MSHPYTEDQLVEQPAIQLFAEMGWRTVVATDEVFGKDGTLSRETRSEVVLEARLREALTKLNPSLPASAIDAAVTELVRDRSAMLPVAANKEVYELLKEGVKVSVPDREHGGERIERVRVIDWRTPQANDFLLVSQMTIVGPLYTCRPDLIAFVNGLPLVVIELKKPGVSAKVAFDDNLTSYKHEQNGVPALFWYNAFLMASNGTDSRIGSLTADWERFFERKRVEREDEPKRVSLETVIRGTCDKARLLDLVENFTLFSTRESGTVKIVAQNHQYLGVNNAIAAMQKAHKDGSGRGGVFWQTQGSGKSFSMVFFAQKILRKLKGNWSFVVVTDRVELDDQIARTFAACGAVSDANTGHAGSGAELRQLLRGNNRYVFTLIHKFKTAEALCDRSDVIVLTDEAHRSQYDTLAMNMRSALPKAVFVAFTGTPLMKSGEEKTREIFGDYVSIYDFKESVEDGATVPLFYENRTPELHLDNPTLNEDIYELIDDAELNEDGEKKLQRELGRMYHLLTRDDRLEAIAKDIVQHFLGRGFQGKAMVVSIDKATALRMHDKVRKYWDLEQKRVEAELAKSQLPPDSLDELRTRLDTIKTTEMALIVSPGQNEIEDMKKLGLDIAPHRKRMLEGHLDERFKKPEDPFRIVFVCAMWLTGFDAPNCSTIYLDKPMRNHTLMQTIARANRVFPGKHNGLIVDYSNVFASLERALAIYGSGGEGDTPVRDKKELVEELKKALNEAVVFCRGHEVDIDAITKSVGMQRLGLIGDAVTNLISPDQLRKAFLSQAGLVAALYKAVKPDKAVLPFVECCGVLATVAETIRARLNENEDADISSVMKEVNKLLDDSIEADGFKIKGGDHTTVLDLSRIDFEALSKRFSKSRHKNVEIEQLKAAVEATLDRLIRLNPLRLDYQKKFEDLISEYNAGSRNIDELFDALVNLTRSLTEEEQRHVRENLSEEELAIFDILTRPDPVLTDEEKAQVKKVVRQLHEHLQALLVIDWKKRSNTRAQVQEAISSMLDSGLPEKYTRTIYQKKCSLVFEHVYESVSA